MAEARLVNPSAAATYLGLGSRWAIYRLVVAGVLPAVKIAGKVRLAPGEAIVKRRARLDSGHLYQRGRVWWFKWYGADGQPRWRSSGSLLEVFGFHREDPMKNSKKSKVAPTPPDSRDSRLRGSISKVPISTDSPNGPRKRTKAQPAKLKTLKLTIPPDNDGPSPLRVDGV